MSCLGIDFYSSLQGQWGDLWRSDDRSVLVQHLLVLPWVALHLNFLGQSHDDEVSRSVRLRLKVVEMNVGRFWTRMC